MGLKSARCCSGDRFLLSGSKDARVRSWNLRKSFIDPSSPCPPPTVGDETHASEMGSADGGSSNDNESDGTGVGTNPSNDFDEDVFSSIYANHHTDGLTSLARMPGRGVAISADR